MKLHEISQTFPEVSHYYDPQRALELPSKYISVNEASGWKTEVYLDMDEIDIIKIAEKSEAFNFLKEPEEEGYDVNDGKPIC